MMVPLLVFVFWIGFYPNTFLDKMNPSLENLIQQVKAKQQIAMMVEAPAPVGSQDHGQRISPEFNVAEEPVHGKPGANRPAECQPGGHHAVPGPGLLRHGPAVDQCLPAARHHPSRGLDQPGRSRGDGGRGHCRAGGTRSTVSRMRWRSTTSRPSST
ncbi:MAG: hypothetical protein MZV64_15595 [Ignavibacteriales bacterium]|nr:hypothetical protein [Ignavibacteriales bacterium]